MFIQTEATPNPSTIKFIPGEEVMKAGQTAQFNSKEEAEKSPLATALFEIEHVTAVFLGSDFISVTKSDETPWDEIKTEILTSIMNHFVSKQAVIDEGHNSDSSQPEEDFKEEDKEIVEQIKELIETRVRPSVAMDGGDIIFKGYNDGVVMLEMHGACSGCPSSTITLKNGIENMLKHYIPEVESVEAV